MAQKKQKRKQVSRRVKGKYIRPAGHTSEDYFWKEVAKKEKIDKQWEQFKKKYSKDVKTAKVVKRVPKKSLAKRLVGKTLAKAIPGAGGAMIAHDVMRAGAKKGCIKRGGKWVGGKCKVAKNSRKKTSGPDPRFSKSRSKKK